MTRNLSWDEETNQSTDDWNVLGFILKFAGITLHEKHEKQSKL